MNKREQLYVVNKAGTNRKYTIGEKKYKAEAHLWDFVRKASEPKKDEVPKGMTYNELKSALMELEVPFKGNAKKEELQALYDLEKDRI
jgi:hypothetical protein